MEVGQVIRIKVNADVMEYHEHLLGCIGTVKKIYPDGDIQVEVQDGDSTVLLALHPEEIEEELT